MGNNVAAEWQARNIVEFNLAKLNPLLCRPSGRPRYLDQEVMFKALADVWAKERGTNHFTIFRREDNDDGLCVAFDAYPCDTIIAKDSKNLLRDNRFARDQRIEIVQMSFSMEFLRQYAEIRYPLEDKRRQTVFSKYRSAVPHRELEELFYYDADQRSVVARVDGTTRLLRISIAPNFIKFGFADYAVPEPQIQKVELPRELRREISSDYTGFPFDVPDLEVVIPRAGIYHLEFLVNPVWGSRETYLPYILSNQRSLRFDDGEEIWTTGVMHGYPRHTLRIDEADEIPSCYGGYFLLHPDGSLPVISFTDFSRYPPINYKN